MPSEGERERQALCVGISDTVPDIGIPPTRAYRIVRPHAAISGQLDERRLIEYKSTRRKRRQVQFVRHICIVYLFNLGNQLVVWESLLPR